MTPPKDLAGAAVPIDARGLRCPLPVLRLEAVLRRVEPGAYVKIRTDDPVARVDIPHFCREGGHQVVTTEADGAVVEFLVARGAGAAAKTVTDK